MDSINRIIFQIKSNEKYALSLLVALAIILRSFFVFYTYNKFGTSKWVDGSYYLLLGEKIAVGNWTSPSGGATDMISGPVVPYLVALFIKLFGNPVVPFLIYNILATSLVVPVFFHLGKEVFGKKTGWLLAIWGALNVEYFRYNADILKEPTIFLLVPVTLLFLIKSIKSNNQIRNIIISAFSFALLIHTDERFFAYLPIFGLVFFISSSFVLKRVITSISIWTGIVFLLMLPWAIHNYKIHNQVIIISPRTTSFTSKLWGKDISGMNSFKGVYRDGKVFEGSAKNSNSSSNGIQLYTKTFINAWQPTYFKSKNVQYCWYEEPMIQKWSLQHNLLSIIFYGVFLPFYIIGIILLIFNFNPVGLFLALIPVIHSLIHTYMLMPEERYRSPVVFIIAMIGFWAAIRIYEIVKKRTIKQKNEKRETT